MNDSAHQHLQKLLATFEVKALGEGDESVGTNLLAAMAITLANLAHPDSRIQTPTPSYFRMGCNLLASGARLTNMILDDVVTPVGTCQENILQHVARLVNTDEEQQQRALRGLRREWNIPTSACANQGESSFLALMTANTKCSSLFQTPGEAWLEVVSTAPSQNFMDMVRRPRAFIVAANPAKLSSQLGSIHAGKALVAISLNRASEVGRFSDLCEALMNGMLPVGPSGEIHKGNLLITDMGNVLPEAAKEGGENSAWVERLVWLVSGNAEPQPPPKKSSEGDVVCLPNVTLRFGLAAKRIFADRMNSRSREKFLCKVDFAEIQTRWMAFLQSMESCLPGISGTARRLLASLVFGLHRMVSVESPPQKLTHYYLEGIEALAQWLIERMANARAAIVFSTEQAQKQRHKLRILAKLSEHCLNLRSIYHPLHLTAADCEAILLELQAEDLVRRQGNKWECIKGASLPGHQSHRLQMKV